jgi:hypothetical protein
MKPIHRVKKREWAANNKEKISKSRRESYEIRIKTDPIYKASKLIRSSLERVVRKARLKKNGRSFDVVGYTPDDLVKRMESLFLEGMSWSNHGEWHIDHIKPVSAFLKEGITDPSIINALSNLQPLWAADNLQKSNKWEETA